MLVSRIATALAFALGVSAAAEGADPGEEVELRQLTSDNFKESTARGVWLVEHFSPRCGHCRMFAPTWERLVKSKSHLERLGGFHMAQVNCIAQGDLCNDNKVKAYPQIMLYIDGKEIMEYREDRNYDLLSDFIDKRALEYADGVTLGLNKTHGRPSQPIVRPNRDGAVAEVDGDGFRALKEQGPMMVKFYAPWCSHCKKLAPTYDELAAEMKGKINIVAVNCDAHRGLCADNKIQGYPTLALIDGESRTDFMEARSLSKMRAFLSKSITPAGMHQIKAKDLAEIASSENEFFVYLQNFDTTYKELTMVETALQKLGYDVPTFTSADPALYEMLHIAKPPPTSALLAFTGSAQPVSSLVLPATESDVEYFVSTHRYPLVFNATSANLDAVIPDEEKGGLVVMAAIRKGPSGGADLETLRTVSRAWRRGGRAFAKPVRFVAIPVDEKDRRSRGLRRYDIWSNNLPAFVVVDTAKDTYYDTTIERQRAQYTGDDIFNVLEGVFQGFVTRKVAVESTWGSGGVIARLFNTVEWATEHPFLAAVAVVGGSFALVYVLSRISRGTRRRHGGYVNEKGVERLD